jgi:hypothetical protein
LSAVPVLFVIRNSRTLAATLVGDVLSDRTFGAADVAALYPLLLVATGSIIGVSPVLTVPPVMEAAGIPVPAVNVPLPPAKEKWDHPMGGAVPVCPMESNGAVYPPSTRLADWAAADVHPKTKHATVTKC